LEQTEIPHLSFLETYLETQTEKVRGVLQENDFIVLDAESNAFLEYTIYGKVAMKMAEVHPLVWSKKIISWNYMSEFTVYQIVGLLSCITEIKVADEFHFSHPKTEDVFLKHRLLELQDEYLRYERIEGEREIRTGISYLNALSFDIIDESMKWCECTNVEECKWFINNSLAEKGIGIGDFTKAMMKIATVSREWMSIEVLAGNAELLYKLNRVEELVLKYIATTQSLYL
jgi:hypothetical protein